MGCGASTRAKPCGAHTLGEVVPPEEEPDEDSDVELGEDNDEVLALPIVLGPESKSPHQSASSDGLEGWVLNAKKGIDAPGEESQMGRNSTESVESSHSSTTENVLSLRRKYGDQWMIGVARRKRNAGNAKALLKETALTEYPKDRTTQEFILDAVAKNVLFENLTGGVHAALISTMFAQTFGDGHVFFSEGEACVPAERHGRLYVVVRGVCTVHQTVVQGEGPQQAAEEVQVAEYVRGQAFGETSLLNFSMQPSTIRAKGEAKMLVLEQTAYNHIIFAANKKLAKEKLELLADVPSLGSLRPPERARLADALEFRTFDSGQCILRAGEQGDVFLILHTLRDGAKVCEYDEQWRVVNQHGPGSFFGDQALLREEALVETTIRVEGPKVASCTCLYLDRATFLDILGPLEEVWRWHSIRKIPLLASLSDDQVSALCKVLVTQTVSYGEYVVLKGEAHVDLFVVESGLFQVVGGRRVSEVYDADALDGKVRVVHGEDSAKVSPSDSPRGGSEAGAHMNMNMPMTVAMAAAQEVYALLPGAPMKDDAVPGPRAAAAASAASASILGDLAHALLEGGGGSDAGAGDGAGLSARGGPRRPPHGSFRTASEHASRTSAGSEQSGLTAKAGRRSSLYESNLGYDGWCMELEKLKHGDYFGEFGLLTSQPYPASVRCVSEMGKVVSLSSETFKRTLGSLVEIDEAWRMAALQRVPELAAASEPVRKLLARTLKPAAYDDGEVIHAGGSQNMTMYILERGRARVVSAAEAEAAHSSPRSPRAATRTAHAAGQLLLNGQCFAARSLLFGESTEENLVAIGNPVLLSLSRSDVADLGVDLYSLLQDAGARRGRANSDSGRLKVIGSMRHRSASGKRTEYRRLEVLSLIGRGGYGSVMLVRCGDGEDEHREKAALKIVDKQAVQAANLSAHLERERKVMRECPSEWLVKLLHTFQDTNCAYMLMEAVLGGSLRKYVQRGAGAMRPQGMDEGSVRFYAACVVMALRHLHSFGYVHRDVKTENLLIAPSGYLKLTDFGFVKQLEPTEKTYTTCGTPAYMAPEILTMTGHGFPVDFWCLGIVIYELTFGYTPFQHETDEVKKLRMVMSGSVPMPVTTRVSGALRGIVRKLLVGNPARRLGSLKGGVRDVMHHQWFADFKWDLMQEQILRPPYIPVLLHDQDDRYLLTRNVEGSDQVTEYVFDDVINIVDQEFPNF